MEFDLAEFKKQIKYYDYPIDKESVLKLIDSVDKIISESRDSWFEEGYDEAKRKYENED